MIGVMVNDRSARRNCADCRSTDLAKSRSNRRMAKKVKPAYTVHACHAFSLLPSSQYFLRHTSINTTLSEQCKGVFFFKGTLDFARPSLLWHSCDGTDKAQATLL